VRVIDFEPGGESNILVLELAEGDTLESVLKAGPIPHQRAVPILAQLAEGLGAIHDKGIIHRDLKPQNVVLTPTPRGEQARLLDFGIARLMEMTEAADSALPPPLPDNPLISHPGQVIGTPAYVAPEQALARPLDARTDVYAFGVLAYRMLSGQLPFAGPGSNDFLKQHVSELPQRLDVVVPQLSDQPELVELVMQCLEKAPEARPASVQALYERLFKLMPQSPYDSSVVTPSRRVIAPGAASASGPPSDPGKRWTEVQEKAAAVTQAWLTVANRGVAAASRISPEWRRSLLIVAGLCLLAPAVWAMLPPTPVERATRLLEKGRAEAALSLLDARLQEATWDVPHLYALKAAALHQVGRELDERELLRSSPYQALHTGHPLLLDALAEDLARNENDVELAALIKMVPGELLRPHFEVRSQEPGSERQWGALRYLDLDKAEVPDLGRRYAGALGAKECYIRAAAARRLAELGAKDAIDVLRQLSETPKEKTEQGLVACGQDEAAEAIRELKR
jgi:hypothetical protein